MRLKGRDSQDVEDGITADLSRGQLERGNSPWGSWAFPVRASGKKVRIVVNYQKVNSRTIRAIYYLRRADDCKQEVLGSIYITLLDAVSGFNQVPNSERAKRVLAVLAASGCYLPTCLTMGGTNGPEDFSFGVDTLFGLGKMHKRRLNNQWVVYVDDFSVRSGRWRHGNPCTDEKYLQASRATSQPFEVKGGGNGAVGCLFSGPELGVFDSRRPLEQIVEPPPSLAAMKGDGNPNGQDSPEPEPLPSDDE